VRYAAVHSFASQEAAARRLAGTLAAPWRQIALRHFPDGESLVRVDPHAGGAILFCSLDRPNAKLVDLLLAASALRDGGATPVVLVAPYLCYMRQDKAFHPGEAVSQKVIAGLISRAFDAVVTVDPHLHRTADLNAIFTVPVKQLSAAPALGQAIARPAHDRGMVLVGPDSEARQWVESAARAGNIPFIVGSKIRLGDRTVEIAFTDLSLVKGQTAVLVDDLVSSGATACKAARLLREAGARRVELHATHVLSDSKDLATMAEAGIARIVSTDSVPHETNAVPLAPLLAAALTES